MQIQVATTSEFTTVQEVALDRLHQAVFPPAARAAEAEERYSWADPQWAVLLWHEDELITHVGIVVRDVDSNGVNKRIGGIGGVMTHPAHQGKGFAGRVMQRAAQYLEEELAVPFALLFCRPELTAFYGRLGWRPFTGTLFVEQPEGRIEFSVHGPKVRDVCEVAPTTGELDLCGLPW